jgi:D-alanyl-D-alanine carboxypeptidase (penicillin-binding protein 5/6)
MFIRTFCLLVSFVALTLSAHAAPAKKKPASAAKPYKGYVVMDAATGEVIAQEDPDTINPPASVTKLMTFLIVHDRIAAGQLTLNTSVQVMDEDAKIGGTQVWLDPREAFSVEELLYALMIQSANDAANALGRASAGSRQGFVEMMNARAKALGMTNTTFRSPHGLPPSSREHAESDLTTPHDLALLARELLLKTDILKYSSVKERAFGGVQRLQPVIMRTHNHLIGKVAGVDGLKTGFTNSAGFCLAATAQRDGRRIIVTIMGSPSSKERDLKVTELIESNFHKIPATSRFVSGGSGGASLSSELVVSSSADGLITPAAASVQPIATAPITTPKVEATESSAPAIQFQVPVTKPARSGPSSTVKQK